MLLVCSFFHGGLFFTLSLRRIFHLVQIKSKAFHVFYRAILWFKVCIRFCSVGILCFHRRILCLSYNSIFKQWLLSGDCARIRGLVSLGPQKKRVRACACWIFTLKMVQSSLTKSKGERSRGTDPLAVERLAVFSPSRDVLSSHWAWPDFLEGEGWRWLLWGEGGVQVAVEPRGSFHKLKVWRKHACETSRRLKWRFVVKRLFWSA